MSAQQHPNDPLHGVTLERIVTELSAYYGWAALAERVRIRCFSSDPSVGSSLKFLRRTPWARTKVEDLYLELLARRAQGTAGPLEGEWTGSPPPAAP